LKWNGEDRNARAQENVLVFCSPLLDGHWLVEEGMKGRVKKTVLPPPWPSPVKGEG